MQFGIQIRNTHSAVGAIAAVVASIGVLAPATMADRNGRPPQKAETKAPEGGVAGGSVSCTCTEDLNYDGVINAADLGALLGSWSTGTNDLNGDGTVNAEDLAIMLGAWGPCAAPFYDSCSTPAILYNQFLGVDDYFCTTHATNSGPSVTGQCGPFATNIFKDIWFEYTPDGDGEFFLDTCEDADFDTIIAVYTSIIPGLNACPPADGELGTSVLVACNDDSVGCPNNRSKLSLDVVGGKTYKIRIGGFNGASGVGTLHKAFKSVGDQCFNGILVTGADEVTETVKGTTTDNPVFQAPCGQTPSKGEWITYIPTCQNQNVTVSTCHPGTDFDTVVTVWRENLSQGCDGHFIECVDDTKSQACLLDGVFRKSRLDFVASAGEIYHILINGYNAGAAGHYECTIKTECFNP